MEDNAINNRNRGFIGYSRWNGRCFKLYKLYKGLEAAL